MTSLKMATGGGSIKKVVIVTKYKGHNVQLQVNVEDNIRSVVSQAAKQLQISDKDLVLLHQGLNIDIDKKVKDVFAELKSSTVVHLVHENQTRFQSSFAARGGQKSELLRREAYIYCKSCGNLAPGRPVLVCNECNGIAFELKGQLDVDEVTDALEGSCTECGCGKARVQFECKASQTGEGHYGAFLNNIYKNRKGVICMKCGVERKDELVYVFNCSKKHVMCILCFEGFCNWQLKNEKFINLKDAGFTVNCPASNCDRKPVLDPHHFYVAGKEFYKEYHEKAMEDYKQKGHLCFCKNALDWDTSTVPVAAQSSGKAGGSWFAKKPIKKEQKKKVVCPQPACKREYCAMCRALWHEGECAVPDANAEEFRLDEDWIIEGSWDYTPK